MDEWRKPLDKFTLSFLVTRLVEDRDDYLARAKEAKEYSEPASEVLLVRAEECARIIGQVRKQIEALTTVPPPAPPKSTWPH